MEEYFAWLTQLRESGRTNMAAASRMLQREFGLTKQEADTAFWAWVDRLETQGES